VICFVKLFYFSIIFYRIFCIIASKTGVMTQPRKRRGEKEKRVKRIPLKTSSRLAHLQQQISGGLQKGQQEFSTLFSLWSNTMEIFLFLRFNLKTVGGVCQVFA
jgi:hypothetical protein